MTWTYINDDPATLPPIDVPVIAVFRCGDEDRRFVGMLAREYVDFETWTWGQCYSGPIWLKSDNKWDTDECLHDDDYRVIAWHPLPDPTEVMR